MKSERKVYKVQARISPKEGQLKAQRPFNLDKAAFEAFVRAKTEDDTPNSQIYKSEKTLSRSNSLRIPSPTVSLRRDSESSELLLSHSPSFDFDSDEETTPELTSFELSSSFSSIGSSSFSSIGSNSFSSISSSSFNALNTLTDKNIPPLDLNAKPATNSMNLNDTSAYFNPFNPSTIDIAKEIKSDGIPDELKSRYLSYIANALSNTSLRLYFTDDELSNHFNEDDMIIEKIYEQRMMVNNTLHKRLVLALSYKNQQIRFIGLPVATANADTSFKAAILDTRSVPALADTQQNFLMPHTLTNKKQILFQTCRVAFDFEELQIPRPKPKTKKSFEHKLIWAIDTINRLDTAGRIPNEPEDDAPVVLDIPTPGKKIREKIISGVRKAAAHRIQSTLKDLFGKTDKTKEEIEIILAEVLDYPLLPTDLTKNHIKLNQIFRLKPVFSHKDGWERLDFCKITFLSSFYNKNLEELRDYVDPIIREIIKEHLKLSPTDLGVKIILPKPTRIKTEAEVAFLVLQKQLSFLEKELSSLNTFVPRVKKILREIEKLDLSTNDNIEIRTAAEYFFKTIRAIKYHIETLKNDLSHEIQQSISSLNHACEELNEAINPDVSSYGGYLAKYDPTESIKILNFENQIAKKHQARIDQQKTPFLSLLESARSEGLRKASEADFEDANDPNTKVLSIIHQPPCATETHEEKTNNPICTSSTSIFGYLHDQNQAQVKEPPVPQFKEDVPFVQALQNQALTNARTNLLALFNISLNIPFWEKQVTLGGESISLTKDSLYPSAKVPKTIKELLDLAASIPGNGDLVENINNLDMPAIKKIYEDVYMIAQRSSKRSSGFFTSCLKLRSTRTQDFIDAITKHCGDYTRLDKSLEEFDQPKNNNGLVLKVDLKLKNTVTDDRRRLIT